MLTSPSKPIMKEQLSSQTGFDGGALHGLIADVLLSALLMSGDSARLWPSIAPIDLLALFWPIVTRSDKRVTRWQFGHPELFHTAQSAIKELSFDASFKTVHKAKVKLWPLNVRGYSRVVISRKWSWKDWHCFSQRRFLLFQMRFKVMDRSKWTVSRKNVIE